MEILDERSNVPHGLGISRELGLFDLEPGEQEKMTLLSSYKILQQQELIGEQQPSEDKERVVLDYPSD